MDGSIFRKTSLECISSPEEAQRVAPGMAARAEAAVILQRLNEKVT